MMDTLEDILNRHSLNAHRAAPVDNFTPLSQVPETVASEPFPGVQLPAQNASTDLMFLRAQFPFLHILPFPMRTVSVALTANVAQQVNIPDGAVLGMFSGGGLYYVSRLGVATIPTLTNSSDSFLAPENAFWYLKGIGDFSIISASNLVVGLAFWSAENWPRR